VLGFARRSRKDGIDAQIDQYVPEPGTLALLLVGRGSMVIGLHRFAGPAPSPARIGAELIQARRSPAIFSLCTCKNFVAFRNSMR
jgi:hypothetical protein